MPLRRGKGAGREPQRRRAWHPPAPPRPSLEVPLLCIPEALVPQVRGADFLLVLQGPPADTAHTQGPRGLLAEFSQPWQQLSWVMPRRGYSFSGSQVTRPGSDRQKVRALPRTSGIPSRTLSSVLPCPSAYPSAGIQERGPTLSAVTSQMSTSIFLQRGSSESSSP